jgi:hypothetical protein
MTRNVEAFPRWKFRAALWCLGLGMVASEATPRANHSIPLIFYFSCLLLVGLLVGLYFFVSRQLRRVNRVLLRAQELHNQGKTAEAIALLQGQRQAGRIDRNIESMFLSEMSRMSMEASDMEAADRYLSEAESISDANQGIYANRADLFVRAGDVAAACDVLRRGVEKLPKSLWLNTVLAERLAEAGRDDEAREVLARAVELMDHEKYLDVIELADWREKRIEPLNRRLGSKGQPLVTPAD